MPSHRLQPNSLLRGVPTLALVCFLVLLWHSRSASIALADEPQNAALLARVDKVAALTGVPLAWTPGTNGKVSNLANMLERARARARELGHRRRHRACGFRYNARWPSMMHPNPWLLLTSPQISQSDCTSHKG